MSQSTPPTLNRRTAFIGAGTAGALAAAAAVLPRAEAPVAAAVAAKPPVDPAGGYQLTDHVKRYYATARV